MKYYLVITHHSDGNFITHYISGNTFKEASIQLKGYPYYLILSVQELDQEMYEVLKNL